MMDFKISDPLVSLIIPTYNRAHLICETLDSVLAQTYQNWECIIVDDGSTDNTVEVVSGYVKKDSRFQLHYRPLERPRGGNAARNYGFEVSTGEFINWFDSDDVMLEDFIKVKVDAITLNLNLIITSGYIVDEQLKNKRTIFLNENANLFKEYCFWSLQILTPSILFRRSYLEGKELFLTTISRGQETELFSRLFFKLSIEKYKILNHHLFLYRQHNNSKSYKNKLYVKKYIESHTYIQIENLKRSVELKDKDLINLYYSALVDNFYRGMENNHTKNSCKILKNLILLLSNEDKFLKIEMRIFGGLFLFFSRGSYRFEKRWKSIRL